MNEKLWLLKSINSKIDVWDRNGNPSQKSLENDLVNCPHSCSLLFQEPFLHCHVTYDEKRVRKILWAAADPQFHVNCHSTTLFFTFLWLKCSHIPIADTHTTHILCVCVKTEKEVYTEADSAGVLTVCLCVDEAGVYFEGCPIWPLWCHRCCVCSRSECSERLVCHLCYGILSWPVYICVSVWRKSV